MIEVIGGRRMNVSCRSCGNKTTQTMIGIMDSNGRRGETICICKDCTLQLMLDLVEIVCGQLKKQKP